ncbi:Dihydrodipicolinate synthetase family protein [compost metagenome]
MIEKNFAKGRKIMAAMMPLMDFLEGGKFVQSIKYGCALNGLSTGGVRKPLYDLDAGEKQELQRVVSELKATIAQIK